MRIVLEPGDDVEKFITILKENNITVSVFAAGLTTYPAAIQEAVLNLPCSELVLSKRARNALEFTRYVGELVQKTDAEMLKTNEYGKKTHEIIKAELKRYGLDFGMTFPGWRPPKTP